MAYIPLALSIASLLVTVYLYRGVQRTLQRHREAINILFKDVDELFSTGPQPETTNPKKEVNGNYRGPESDGLPLTGHTVIVGQSGSGKSNVAMSQIMRRIQDGHEVYIVDTKAELGPLFRKHVKRSVNADDADKLFDELINIANKRQELFADTMEKLKRPCRDRGEYFKLTGNKLPVISVFIEELIALMETVDEGKLIKLLVLGRSAGVFVVALAQYLRSDTLSKKGSINFNTKVYLGRYDKDSFSILFGYPPKDTKEELQNFLGSPGKGVVEEAGNLTTRTFPRIEDYHLMEWMK